MGLPIITDENYHTIVRKLISDDRTVPKSCNLQNIPARGDGVRVRMGFVPRKGYIFVGADLGQIEPRIMAHIMYTQYNDNSMRQIFVDGVDLYTTMAMMTFNLAEEYCVDKAYDPTGSFKPRALMKTGVLAVAYDQSPKSFAKKMGVTDDVAAFFFENFDRTFPSFRRMVTDIREGMHRKGFIQTLYGRKRRFPDFKRVSAEVARNEQRLIQLYTERKRLRNSTNPQDTRRLIEVQEKIDKLAELRGLVGYWDRAAFNGVIQGTGADILKMNGNRNREICIERGWEFNASIHDEIKDSIPYEQITPETIELVNEIMTKTVKLSVPLVTDIVIEPRWMEEYNPYTEWDYENCRPQREAIDKYKKYGITPQQYGYAA